MRDIFGGRGVCKYVYVCNHALNKSTVITDNLQEKALMYSAVTEVSTPCI